MRSCIEVVFQDLIARIQAPQQKHKNAQAKIQFLADHAALATIPASHFAPLMSQYAQLHDDLCAGKEKAVLRPVVSSTFNRAIAFLNSLLSGLDEGRFKPRTK